MEKNQRHTYNSGIIGNCAYIAHIGLDSDVNWLCWPTFEDSFAFGSLLDQKKGGEFSIRPSGKITGNKQYYIENTNILCTEISSEDGSYKITDFAPRFEQYERYYKPLILIRKVEPIDGYPKIKVTCRPTYQYGKQEFHKSRGSNHVQYRLDTVNIRLATNMPVSHFFENDIPYVLAQPIYLILTFGNAFEAPIERTAEEFLSRTTNYWQKWIKNASIPNFYQKEVIRSALVLKLHQYEDTGAIIAASTTSLPEYPGSGRNWDYRYCWLRDSYYVLTALSHIGQFEEMEKYAAYIANITHMDTGRLQPLYGIFGQHKLEESTLDHLDGYLNNRPIRIGNQAHEHIQNDVYGQALIALLPLLTDSRFNFKSQINAREWTSYILQKIQMTIDEFDAGIWEFRQFENRHCYSNLFQWAGSTAALKIARMYNMEDIAQKARLMMNKAKQHIEACYDRERKVYTNATNSENLDASTLQLIMMNYLDPASEKAKKHLTNLEKELKGQNGLFYRYLHKDDFGKPKSTFLVCAFWYVEALACVGRVDEAQEILNNLIGYSNHLLLFSEDVCEDTGSQWGNFPQAYSHVGLVNAAYRIAVKLDQPTFFEKE